MNDTIDDFMRTNVSVYDRGYFVFLSPAPEFATEAVVRDADGNESLVDLSNEDWDDGEDMADKAVEVYEGKVKS